MSRWNDCHAGNVSANELESQDGKVAIALPRASCPIRTAERRMALVKKKECQMWVRGTHAETPSPRDASGLVSSSASAFVAVLLSAEPCGSAMSVSRPFSTSSATSSPACLNGRIAKCRCPNFSAAHLELGSTTELRIFEGDQESGSSRATTANLDRLKGGHLRITCLAAKIWSSDVFATTRLFA
ncbi:hypothetical protein KC320_g158 [Hortaea werneckii]|nr:hypothetical protein KC320_g158 [Hortaea werneckii]